MMVKRTMAPTTHQSSNPRFETLVSHKTRNVFSPAGYVTIDREASVLTSSILRPAGSVSWILSLGGTHKDSVCVHAHVHL
jgi:hypothetical protein